MEAVSLSDISVTCARELIFLGYPVFGVPETITSDCGPLFTSNVWSQLCEMLNITQTTCIGHKGPRAACLPWRSGEMKV
jgi:hypothetical protein